jgi:hypothetical protein
MTPMLDCPTCGGLIPADRRCCPHCHCKSSAWKRWALVASATMGLGAAGCGGGTDHGGVADMSHAEFDLSQPEPVVEYGPAPPRDFSTAD